MLNGKRLEWLVNYRDDRNYDLFQLDEKGLGRIRCVNGKKGDPVKKPHSIKVKEYVIIKIAVTFASIVHSIYEEGRWQVVDDWKIPGGELPGKFGFRVPGRDQIGVSAFSFTPN